MTGSVRCSLREAALLAVLSCTPPPAGDAEPVESGPHLSLADSALVRFGHDQDSLRYDLSRYASVELLSDGRLAVLCCENAVMIFAADGSRQAAFGGRGVGPNQFRSARMVKLAGDTLLVYDNLSLRATWIHPTTGFLRTTQLGTAVPTHHATPVGVDSRGNLLLSSLHRFFSGARNSTTDSSRTLAEVIVAAPGQATKVLFEIPDVLLVPRPAPFEPNGPPTMDLVRYGGTASITTIDGRMYVLAGGSRTVQVRQADGVVLRELVVPGARRAVSPRDREANIEMETAPLRGENPSGHAPPPDPRAVLKFLETAVFADSFPPAETIVGEVGGGHLWVVQGNAINAAGWRAIRMSLEGDSISTVVASLPGSRPLAFTPDAVLLARVDAEGVTTFELRRLGPRPALPLR